MAVSFEITVKDQIGPLLERIQAKAQGVEPVLNVIGETVLTSIQQNFEQGGRPTKWKALSPITVKQRQKIRKWPGQILIRSGRLEGSINYQTQKDRVVFTANAAHAATQHFGAAKGSFGVIQVRVKEHLRRLKSGKKTKVKTHSRVSLLPWGDIPARPFMMVQDRDWDEIRDQLNKLLFEA